MPLAVPVPAGLGGRCLERRGAAGEAAVLPAEEAHVGITDALELQAGQQKGTPAVGSQSPWLEL